MGYVSRETVQESTFKKVPMGNSCSFLSQVEMRPHL